MTDLILETGKVKTCDGREVRIYATDGGGTYPVHGAIKLDHEWEFETWKLSGSYTDGEQDHRYDLTAIPQPQYFNIYTNPNGKQYTGYMCSSIAEAKEQAVKCARNKTKLDDTYKYLDGEITKVEESSNDD